LYQISSNDEGQDMYLFLMGSALFYSPWFGIAHLHAHVSDLPANGFSEPYQFWLVIGALLYTLLGLWYFRRILLHFLPDKISAAVLFIIVVGSNYAHHLSLKNLETVNILFFLLALLIWHTIRWEEEKKFKNMMICGIAVSLMALVKPSEIVAGLIPLFWSVNSKSAFVERLNTFLAYRRQILLSIGIALLLLLPQMLYWHHMTGSFVFDSYKNPGVGLDLTSPHILNVLFSFRKGWLIYTPIMIFAIVGLVFFFKQKRKESAALLLYFLITFYIIASWTEWWYGAGFSNRPLVTTYVILGIGIGFFINYILQKSIAVKLIFAFLISSFILLNQFQWWQLRHYILDPYRTTKASYLASFFATEPSTEIESKKLIPRDFSGEMEFTNPQGYHSTTILNFNALSRDSSVYIVTTEQEFPFEFSWTYKEITSQDHFWMEVHMEVMRIDNSSDKFPLLAVFADHNGSYGYRAFPLQIDSTEQWTKLTFHYLSPEIRNKNDKIKIHLWNRHFSKIAIRNFYINKYEKIE
jgi:hypothetical protein